MRERGVKLQITLPKELAEQVDKEVKNSYTTRSALLIKVIHDFLENKAKEEQPRKKVLELNIK
jgi:metal-responsive CopG/Arc/MetJ family transcriptional regulator